MEKQKQKTGKEIIYSISMVMSVIILAVISTLIVSSILSNPIFDNAAITGTNTNETLINVTNITYSDFSILLSHPSSTCTLSAVYNSTSGELLTAENYTYGSCSIILADTSAYIGTNLNVTYGYSYPSGLSSTGLNVTAVKEEFGLFITGIMGFLGILGVLIGIVWLISYIRKLFDNDGLQSLSS